MTTSFTFFTLLNVSLWAPVLPLLDGENTAIGGLELKTLKNENGAKLGTPFHQPYSQNISVWVQQHPIIVVCFGNPISIRSIVSIQNFLSCLQR